MRQLVKYIAARTYQPWLLKYLSRTRRYVYHGIRLDIPPQVFHPGFFYSTRFLLRYLRTKNLEGKTLLELGAGSGLISVFASVKAAQVTASDISLAAVQCLHRNRELNRARFEILHSDLFQNIPKKIFDLIVINPPYYFRRPLTESEYAWYCGENGEYFKNLFSGLGQYMDERTEVLMVLCDGCELTRIHAMAKEKGFHMERLMTQRTLFENNYIFQIKHRPVTAVTPLSTHQTGTGII